MVLNLAKSQFYNWFFQNHKPDCGSLLFDCNRVILNQVFVREVDEFILHTLDRLNRLLVRKSVNRTQMKKFPICDLSHFVYLEIMTLENRLSFELAIEKSHASVCNWY